MRAATEATRQNLRSAISRLRRGGAYFFSGAGEAGGAVFVGGAGVEA
jgi:hypothetical protein